MAPLDRNPGSHTHEPRVDSIAEPVRMVKIAQFLPPDEREALYAAACENQMAFQAPGGPGSKVEGSLFLSTDSDSPGGAGVDSMRVAGEPLAARILEVLPQLFSGLGIDPFALSEIPLNFIHGLDSHFATPHVDSLDSRFEISLLYYFHKSPRVFRGGELEFYAADPESDTGYREEPLARIDHEDNLLIAFPSKTYHGVTEVQCDSADFGDGRFVAVGFLGKK